MLSVAWAGFDAVVGLLQLWFPGFRCCSHEQISWRKLSLTITPLPCKAGVAIMPRIVASWLASYLPSGPEFSCIFHFGSSRGCESQDSPKLFGRKPQHLLGHRSHLRGAELHPVQWQTNDHQFVGQAERRRGAPRSAFWGKFWDVAWAVAWSCGRFILIAIRRFQMLNLHRDSWANLLEKIVINNHRFPEKPELLSCPELWNPGFQVTCQVEHI